MALLSKPLLFMLLVGCSSTPPAGQKNWLDFLIAGVTTRELVTERLGSPDAVYEGGRIVAYWVAVDEGGYYKPHPPKVGAVCPNRARTDLCGGRPAMDVPTAIEKRGRHPAKGNSGQLALKFQTERNTTLALPHGPSIRWHG
jgi:hypothetical protein